MHQKILKYSYIQYLVFACISVAWLFFLFFSIGNLWDETEHNHIAWLMGVAHQRPYIDFFQHHQPLLWDVLRLYFRLGGQGLGVVYFGRSLLVIGTVITLELVRRLSLRFSKTKKNQNHTGLLPGFVLITLGLTRLQGGYTVRPETLGFVLYFLSVFFWSRPPIFSLGSKRRHFTTWIAGMFFGFSLVASPRFLGLAGGYLLLNSDHNQLYTLIRLSGFSDQMNAKIMIATMK